MDPLDGTIYAVFTERRRPVTSRTEGDAPRVGTSTLLQTVISFRGAVAGVEQ
jgi:hypothetical protein